MQNKKEYSTGVVKTLKKKVHDWGIRHPWPARILEYNLLFLLVSFVVTVIFAYFDLFHTDAVSARYMLSALVQSQAAIVAIVVSLTLIAVQLTASAYSPRVIDIFISPKKNPDFWILLLFYGLSIFYGLLVLKMISEGDLRQIPFLNTPLEYHISSSYFLGTFTFFMLFPYMWNIINLLNPASIIKRLAIEITKDKILNTEEDPIQPIMDIIHGSIMKYDLETTRVGLKTVTDQVLEIICPDGEEKISRHFCGHLQRVGRLATSREDEDSTIEVIENLEKFAKSTAEKGLGYVTAIAARSLGEVGKAAAEKGLENAAWNAARSLGEVGKAAAEKGLEVGTCHAAGSFGAVGKAAAEKGLEEATKQAVVSLGKVGNASAEKYLGDATRNVVVSLRAVGSAAAEKGLEDAAWDAAEFLEAVGKYAMEQGLEGTKLEVIESLYVLGQNFMEKGLETPTGRVLKALLAIRQIAEKVVASNLASLTLLNEKIVKTAIQDYESNLEEKDRDSFQKFMELYKQKLENCEPRNDAKISKAHSRT